MATSETTTSKRNALRFSGYDRQVRYKTSYEDGEARLVNISAIGCALSDMTEEVELGEKILLSLTLEEPAKEEQVQAVVTRTSDNLLGLRFLHIGDDLKSRIVRFFARETRKRKNSNI